MNLASLHAALADLDPSFDAQARLDKLIASGLDRLPLPGRGETLLRWQALAAVARSDLSLAKLYEGHTDALAILAELGGATKPGSWGVWAAEAPHGRAVITDAGSVDGPHEVRLEGGKCWCSGAASANAALLTAWFVDGQGPQLVSVSLDQTGVSVDGSAWQAVGMRGSASLDVAFDRAVGRLVGRPGEYLSRPGFWHGGAGIAACWYGGALALAEALRRSVVHASFAARGPFRLAALGRVDVELQSTSSLLRECAAWIDANPDADAQAVALRARLRAEACATRVLDEVGRALGATPFCRDAHFARFAADLPIFIRQSHAERDLAALGELVPADQDSSWQL